MASQSDDDDSEGDEEDSRPRLASFWDNWQQLKSSMRRDLEDHFRKQDQLVETLVSQNGERPNLVRSNGVSSLEVEDGETKHPATPWLIPEPMDSKSIQATDSAYKKAYSTFDATDSAYLVQPTISDVYLSEESQYRRMNADTRLFSWRQQLFSKILAWDHWWKDLEEPPRSGLLFQLVSGNAFGMTAGLVIAANAVYTAFAANYEISHLHEERTAGMLFVEIVFVSFYCMEFLLKIVVHRLYYFCNKDASWNTFDFLLVSVAVFDQVATSLGAVSGGNVTFARSLRILKIGRILRVMRALRFLRELHVMVRSILSSFMSLFWSVAMLLLIVIIFGLYFVQSMAGHMLEQGDDLEPEREETILQYFSSVQRTALTLYQSTTGGLDWETVYNIVEGNGNNLFDSLVFVFYITFFNFAVMNILTGIFVESAMKFAAPDREQIVLEQRRKDLEDGAALAHLIRSFDPEDTGVLTKRDFTEFVRNENFGSHLRALGLDVHDAELFFQTMMDISGHEQVTMDDFVEHCMRMKGTASSIDLQGVSFQAKLIHREVQQANEAQLELIRRLAIVLAGPEGREFLEGNDSYFQQSARTSGRMRRQSHRVTHLEAMKDKLVLAIVGARNLPFSTKAFNKRQRSSDVYCVCQLVGKPETRLRTGSIKNDSNPWWHAEFAISQFEAGDSIEFSVVDKHQRIRNGVVGKAVLTSDLLEKTGFCGELPLTGENSRGYVHVKVKLPLSLVAPGCSQDSDMDGLTDSGMAVASKTTVPVAQKPTLAEPRPSSVGMDQQDQPQVAMGRKSATVKPVRANSKLPVDGGDQKSVKHRASYPNKRATRRAAGEEVPVADKLAAHEPAAAQARPAAASQAAASQVTALVPNGMDVENTAATSTERRVNWRSKVSEVSVGGTTHEDASTGEQKQRLEKGPLPRTSMKLFSGKSCSAIEAVDEPRRQEKPPIIVRFSPSPLSPTSPQQLSPLPPPSPGSVDASVVSTSTVLLSVDATATPHFQEPQSLPPASPRNAHASSASMPTSPLSAEPLAAPPQFLAPHVFEQPRSLPPTSPRNPQASEAGTAKSRPLRPAEPAVQTQPLSLLRSAPSAQEAELPRRIDSEAVHDGEIVEWLSLLDREDDGRYRRYATKLAAKFSTLSDLARAHGIQQVLDSCGVFEPSDRADLEFAIQTLRSRMEAAIVSGSSTSGAVGERSEAGRRGGSRGSLHGEERRRAERCEEVVGHPSRPQIEGQVDAESLRGCHAEPRGASRSEERGDDRRSSHAASDVMVFNDLDSREEMEGPRRPRRRLKSTAARKQRTQPGAEPGSTPVTDTGQAEAGGGLGEHLTNAVQPEVPHLRGNSHVPGHSC